VLSPVKTAEKRRPLVGTSGAKAEDTWTSWSLRNLRTLSTRFTSLVGADEHSKNERKRKAMHQEASYVIQNMAERVKYLVVFAVMECVDYFVVQRIGVDCYVPFWNQIKLTCILWLQLPYVPYSAHAMYAYVVMPLYALDITHMDHTGARVSSPADSAAPSGVYERMTPVPATATATAARKSFCFEEQKGSDDEQKMSSNVLT